MKIAVPATASDLDAPVALKLGTAPYLLIIETETMAFEALEAPFDSTGPGAGIQALTLILEQGVRTILVGFISPGITAALADNDIDVVTRVTGTAQTAVEGYLAGQSGMDKNQAPAAGPISSGRIIEALKQAVNQFRVMMPILLGIILLTGLFQGFISKDMMLTVFQHHQLMDALTGTLLGSILTGNPVNSYVIGETLLNMGVSLYAVTAFLFAWVNIGFVQLPAEIAALGCRYAVSRTAAALVLCIPMALLTVFFVRALP
ncbi:MAG: NifB/NifX family molybdenum-iron cluster-binding protein [Deltaproteobacteria bacterium]|nr:NifB/NifX family molybdenum-iron cluster-binding protein [Deltaproteobacteria bacterium]